ncbi:helix-turn-helix transcriptional regulator [uncultured Adlercreutzia sp.]|nr:helix-turn-helix transcriptional regulator [uncultured Adlercreutzia sp.]
MSLDFVITSKLRAAREERGISYAELGRRIGIDGKRLWYILNGDRTMRADEFIKLCAFFNLGLGCFIDKETVAGLRSPNPF